MRRTIGWILGLLVALSVSQAHAQRIAVETFVSTIPSEPNQPACSSWTVVVPLPGTPLGPEIEFLGITIASCLDFTPGSVTFDGQPVDFDGTEASFLASTYSGRATFAVNSGPATVPVTGEGTITGAVDVDGTVEIGPVDLGSNFGVNRLDVLSPQATISVTASTPSWSSGVVPELNGVMVEVEAEVSVFNVDAINGIVDLVISGTIFATPSTPAVPSLPAWALILFATGILAMAVLLLRQRMLANTDPPRSTGE